MEGHKRLRCSNYKKDEDVIFISYYMNGGGTVTLELPFNVIKYWLLNNGYLQIPYINYKNGRMFLFLETCTATYFYEHYMNKDIMELYLNHPSNYNPLKSHYIEKWII